jgi:hypothetical protein
MSAYDGVIRDGLLLYLATDTGRKLGTDKVSHTEGSTHKWVSHPLLSENTEAAL